MYDPRARRRPTSAERSLRTFYRMALLGGVLVALAVLASMFTGPATELIERRWSEASGSFISKVVSVTLNSTLYLLAYLLPMLLVAGGVAMPVIALVRFREFALHPRHRVPDGPRFPLRTAWLLVLAEVPALILFAAAAMTLVGTTDARNPGLNNQEIYLEPPGEEMHYYTDG